VNAMTEITSAGPTMVSSPASATRPARLSPDLMVALGLTLAAAIGGVVLIRTGEIFFADMLIRITILALAAQSLNLLIGFAGLVSFGHAVYLGLGGYAVGILASHEVLSGPLQLAVALGAVRLLDRADRAAHPRGAFHHDHHGAVADGLFRAGGPAPLWR
jgi:branched-chain amino acid transport system permease protein